MFLATHPPSKLFQKILFALLALGILAGAHKHTLASAPIGDDLEAVLRITPSNQPIEVVVTFWERAGIGLLDGLSVPYLPLKVLPMAGAYMTPEQIAAARNRPEVRSIHYNAPLEFYIRESVPLTGAPQVWAQGETGQNVTIAVLDTGIDGTHPDLAFPNKTIAQVKFIHTQYASWAHGNNTETVGLFVEGVPQTDTTSGHGSHVAGIAAGAGAADPAFKGMAPGAKLVGLGAGDDFFVYEALKGFDWLFIRDSNGIPNHQKYNIRVVNNSWGGGGGLELRVNHPIVLATYEAYKAGINVVFAAGNSGPTPDTFNFYALPPWNIGVASTDKVPSLSGFSSRGYPNHPFKLPTVSAPGSGIQAANFYAWAAAPQTTKSGTSMASPHVAGLVALLVSANPKLSPDQVQEILRSGTRSMDLQAWQAGAGFIDAAAAYALARNIAGNLDPFLAGQQAHSPESADATPLPYQRVEFEWSNTLGPSAGVLVSRQDQPFTVHDQTEFLSVFVEWDRTAEDLDLILTSPTGKVHRSPTGIVDRALGPLGAGKTIRITHPEKGNWTARVQGFISTLTSYAAAAVEYRVSGASNWPLPDSGPADFDWEIAVDGFFKLSPAVLGFRSTYFRSGDSGFFIYEVLDASGNRVRDAKINVHFVDRDGNVVMTDRSYFRRSDDTGYQVSNVSFNDTWTGPSGPYSVTFESIEGKRLKFSPGVFFLNHLEVNAKTYDTGGAEQNTFAPGQTIRVAGTLTQVNTVAANDLESSPALDAAVGAQLITTTGDVVATAGGRSSPLTGEFTLDLLVPGSSDNLAAVRVDATLNDLLLTSGPRNWYGRRVLAVRSPEKPYIPEVSLEVSPSTVGRNVRTIHIGAEVTHQDGIEALTSVQLTVSDLFGRVTEKWSITDFAQAGSTTLSLQTAHRIRSKGPWRVRLRATDRNGAVSTIERQVDSAQ